MDVRIPTLQFLCFLTSALACDKYTLVHDDNAVRNCTNTDQFSVCTSTCKDGFAYNDDTVVKTFECDNGVWSYNLENATSKFCLHRYWPLRTVNIQIRGRSFLPYYDLCGNITETELLFNDQIKATVGEISRSCNVEWILEDKHPFYLERYHLRGSITLFTEQTVSNNHLINKCIDPIETEQYFRNATILAASLSPCVHIFEREISESVTDRGLSCPILSAVLKSDAFCVTCGPGFYVSSNTCERCPNNTYQDSMNGTSCKPCPSGHYLAGDQSSCIALCPPGYLFLNEYTPCVPCSVDHYWVDSLTCRPCQPNTDTRGKSGALECLGEVENTVPARSATQKQETNNGSIHAMLAVLMVISVCSIGINVFILYIWRSSQNKSDTGSSSKGNDMQLSTVLVHQSLDPTDEPTTAGQQDSGKVYMNMSHHGGESAPSVYEQLERSGKETTGQLYEPI